MRLCSIFLVSHQYSIIIYTAFQKAKQHPISPRDLRNPKSQTFDHGIIRNSRSCPSPPHLPLSRTCVTQSHHQTTPLFASSTHHSWFNSHKLPRSQASHAINQSIDHVSNRRPCRPPCRPRPAGEAVLRDAHHAQHGPLFRASPLPAPARRRPAPGCRLQQADQAVRELCHDVSLERSRPSSRRTGFFI